MEEKNTLYWIRGNGKNPKGVKKAMEEKGIIITDNDIVWLMNIHVIFYGCEGVHFCYVDDDSFVGCVIRSCGVELQPIEEPKFKDGDFIIDDAEEGSPGYAILKGDFDDGMFESYADIDYDGIFDRTPEHKWDTAFAGWRLMTEEEKQHFLDVMHQNGKDWDAENKRVIDWKQEETFKPGDMVIVRDSTGYWKIDFFSHYDEESPYPFRCVASIWEKCHHYEPYMEKYLGTGTPFEQWEKPQEKS